MKKLWIATTFAACAVTAVATIAITDRLNEEPPDPHLAETVIASRNVIVSLPDDYAANPAKRYPVLYVLDGSSQTGHTAESARLLARIGVTPGILVVGLPSSDENRAQDYTPPYMRTDSGQNDSPAGEADRFLRFIHAELIPAIEQRYRTNGIRMLAGHSRGGLFVVYSLLAEPELFQARFAFSPALWRDDDRIVRELAHSLKPKSGFLYLSLGDAENAKMTAAFRKTIATLRASAEHELRWQADITQGANHSDNAILSTPVALDSYFRSAASTPSR